MNRTKIRELLSSERIIQCMIDAYSYEGDALVVQMTPENDFSRWVASDVLDTKHKGTYELVLIGTWKYEWLRRDDVVVESPRSGGPIDDEWVRDCFGELWRAGYVVLAWRPCCDEAMPYMDRRGNTLPIEERPPLKNSEELEDTADDSTVSELRKQILELKRTVKEKEIQQVRHMMSSKKNMARYYDIELNYENEIERYRGAVQENELLVGLLDKMALSSERKRSKYLELKAAMLQLKLDLADSLKHFDVMLKHYDDEKAKNIQSPRLIQIGNDFKRARDTMDKESTALRRIKKEMEAAEQNLMEELGTAD
ncbi:uncharacterized protein FMAN_12043 [Fusarium mangiferae]|uniref:Uncharacterized protein n=1 Tax=Fusarium mangiferae TaxID=192010 RepID=A0A1L7UHF0_FUSMA|nr:uncharacterized protein FMAN_12043 [Fusarium mangiferae]CVL06951.1 uncharacterized protein FMAN_12043 [Fusarium mangiferae]